MPEVTYRTRRAVQIENNLVRLTAVTGGGHIAEICHKASGVNPLWTPPWPSIEPSDYQLAQHPEYGSSNESQLLSGILGHNICLDTFGAPSAEEAAAGMPVHGEAPVAPFQATSGSDWIKLEAILTRAQLRFERRISLSPDSMVLRFTEVLENLSLSDRPVAWTQHVTVGPPFLERGRTQFRASATRSKVIEAAFNPGKDIYQSGAEFEWPLCPRTDGGMVDFRTFTSEEESAGFTAHLMNSEGEHAWFLTWSPATKVLFGYVWKQQDFPWLARWEENHLRQQAPWNGQGLTCGMEFGVSPMVESRRQMVTRGSLFGVPTFRWAPARSCIQVSYCAFITTAESMPEGVVWDGNDEVRLLPATA